MEWQLQNMDQICIHKIPHISPLIASYGMSFVMILEKIDCVIMSPQCDKSSKSCTFFMVHIVSSVPETGHTIQDVQ